MPSTFFPTGRVDDDRRDPAPIVLNRSPRGRVAEDRRPVRWEASSAAAQRLAAYVQLPASTTANELRDAATRALAAARPRCVFAGRSPRGCDVWALPVGGRRIGLVFGASDPEGVRTVVLILSPDKMDEAYPTGEPLPDWQLELARGTAALSALGELAAADPKGPAAAAYARISCASEADLRV